MTYIISRDDLVEAGRSQRKTLQCLEGMKAQQPNIIQYAATHDNAMCIWLACNYNEARVAYDMAVRHLRDQCFQNEARLGIRLFNDAQIYFYSLGNPHLLRGLKVNYAALEASISVDEPVYRDIVLPALLYTKQSIAVRAWSPIGSQVEVLWSWNDKG